MRPCVSFRPRRRTFLCLIFCLLAALGPGTAHALGPDELLLIVNKHVPEGQVLAQYYAAKRGVDPARIVSLDLPVMDDISFASYERDVLLPLRDFLTKNGLRQKVKCIVPFYGVPLRIGAKINTPQENDEINGIVAEVTATQKRLAAEVQKIEAAAVAEEPSFAPASGADIDALGARALVAWRVLSGKASKIKDLKPRNELIDRINTLMMPLMGRASVMKQQAGDIETRALHTPDEEATAMAEMEQLKELRQRVLELQRHMDDPVQRQALRQLVHDNFSPFEYVRILRSQATSLGADNTPSAFDNELALMWWNFYPKSSWQPNPLYFRNRMLPDAPRTMMVMRLDGPQPGSVRDIIVTSLKAETEGLTGRVVIDSRGRPLATTGGKPDPYGAYDQTLRNLANLIRGRTQLPLVFDEGEAVLPANSVRNVALYCGWYSVRHYVPCCHFNAGAVGYHVASLEAISLHNEAEPGWCRGLLNDGIAATLGAVAEPYLHSFPAADEFFPLLLTGKLTLAEVYWKTTPLTSWMITMIGDPLYKPFAKNPQLTVDDLPGRLRMAIDDQQPGTFPALPASGPSSH